MIRSLILWLLLNFRKPKQPANVITYCSSNKFDRFKRVERHFSVSKLNYAGKNLFPNQHCCSFKRKVYSENGKAYLIFSFLWLLRTVSFPIRHGAPIHKLYNFDKTRRVWKSGMSGIKATQVHFKRFYWFFQNTMLILCDWCVPVYTTAVPKMFTVNLKRVGHHILSEILWFFLKWTRS